MDVVGIEQLRTQGAVWSGFTQGLFRDFVATQLSGGYRYSADAAAGWLSLFDAEGRRLDARMEVLASISVTERALIWGRSLGYSSPEGERLREYGLRSGQFLLSSDRVELNFEDNEGYDASTTRAGAERLAHDVGMAVGGITGRMPYFIAPGVADPQGALLLLLEVPGLARPRIEGDFASRLWEASGALPGVDLRPGVHRLAELSGWGLQWGGGSIQLVDPANGQRAEVLFDQAGGLIDVRR